MSDLMRRQNMFSMAQRHNGEVHERVGKFGSFVGRVYSDCICILSVGKS